MVILQSVVVAEIEKVFRAISILTTFLACPLCQSFDAGNEIGKSLVETLRINVKKIVVSFMDVIRLQFPLCLHLELLGKVMNYPGTTETPCHLTNCFSQKKLLIETLIDVHQSMALTKQKWELHGKTTVTNLWHLLPMRTAKPDGKSGSPLRHLWKGFGVPQSDDSDLTRKIKPMVPVLGCSGKTVQKALSCFSTNQLSHAIRKTCEEFLEKIKLWNS